MNASEFTAKLRMVSIHFQACSKFLQNKKCNDPEKTDCNAQSDLYVTCQNISFHSLVDSVSTVFDVAAFDQFTVSLDVCHQFNPIGIETHPFYLQNAIKQ